MEIGGKHSRWRTVLPASWQAAKALSTLGGVIFAFVLLSILLSYLHWKFNTRNEMFFRTEIVRVFLQYRDRPELKPSLSQTLAEARAHGYEFSLDDLVEMYLGANLPDLCHSSLTFGSDGKALVNPRHRSGLEGFRRGFSRECEDRANRLLMTGVPEIANITRSIQ